ncbi:hypothetical protein PT7_0054 [Pusillimonas sp. T7-7]|nr:hypothetical protein PT7_0054 [Pusillimonas sp. T7-7]
MPGCNTLLFGIRKPGLIQKLIQKLSSNWQAMACIDTDLG